MHRYLPFGHSLVPVFAPVLFALILTGISSVPAAAQPVLELTQELDFDEPEAWAMKYFTSASLLTSLGPVERREPGSIDLGLELIGIPHLNQAERTVGFGGIKEEDLNRTPVWGRLRATFGLPAGFAVTLGWVPPAEIDGVKANLVSLAVERRLLARGPWSLGARLHGQVGETEGDFTCGRADVAFPSGSPRNPFGCESVSEDTVTMDYVGFELTGAYAFDGHRETTLHAGAGVQDLDMELQVDAVTFGFRDRTLLLADGTTWSLTAGATWNLGGKARLGLEAFYSPLDVQRLGEASDSNDGLLNLRALVRYRLR